MERLNINLQREEEERARSRSSSVTSFCSAVSAVSESGTTPVVTGGHSSEKGADGLQLHEKVRAITELMLQEIANIEAAAKKQPNINKKVTGGVQTLKAMALDLQKLCEEESRLPRTGKRLRSQRDSPEAPQGIQNPKKKKAGDKRVPIIQVTEDGATPMQSKPGTSQVNEENTGWTQVVKRGKKKKKEGPGSEATGQNKVPARNDRGPNRRRGGAVLIVPKEGKTFADVVRTLRTLDTQDSNTEVRGVTKTKDGAVLVRTTGSDQRPDRLSVRLREALQDQGDVKDVTPKQTLEILDLDCVTEVQEVRDALDRVLEPNTDRKVSVLGPNSRGQKMAICDFGVQDATRLLQVGRIKIGFVSCRVRARLTVQRCYKCLGYGHNRTDCNGPDRRDCCWKCGEQGHKAKGCSKTPACYLCSQQGGELPSHIPGSARCASFRKALTEARARQGARRAG